MIISFTYEDRDLLNSHDYPDSIVTYSYIINLDQMRMLDRAKREIIFEADGHYGTHKIQLTVRGLKCFEHVLQSLGSEREGSWMVLDYRQFEFRMGFFSDHD